MQLVPDASLWKCRNPQILLWVSERESSPLRRKSWHIRIGSWAAIYDGSSYEENLNKYRIPPTIDRSCQGGFEKVLLGRENTPYFGITEAEVTGEFPMRRTGTFSVAIVLEGEGEIAYSGGTMEIKKGSEIFLPAGIKDPVLRSRNNTTLKVVQAFPPEVI